MPTAITFGSIAARAFGFLGRVLRKDAFFNYVTLLLTGNGTNGAQNNTFLDSSTNNFTITRNGNTTQGAFTPYGDNWSNYFDGTGDYLTAPDNAAFDFGAGNFTVECWVYANSLPAENPLVNKWNAGTVAGTNQWYLYLGGATPTFIGSTDGTNYQVLATGPNIISNNWSHIVIVRNGTSFTVYTNGVAGTSQTLAGSLFANDNELLGIGYRRQSGAPVIFAGGYISNVRIVKGTALYTANFTPPTAPLTAVANTSLLTCQSNRFIDNSSNNFTITRNGDVSVQRFSPFNPTAAYAAGTIGGSGYFDGSGDYLSIAGNSAFDFGTGDFTIEAWFYLTAATGAYRSIITIPHGSGGMGIRFGSQTDYSSFLQVTILGNTAAQVYSANINQSQLVNSWVHVALTRASSTCRFFVNGVQQNTGTGVTPSSFPNATFTDNTNITSNGTNEIGRGSDNVTVFLGYISNVRVLKGTAQYTANFTPPTQPLTAITNTSLLTNFTNGGIIDNAMMNDLETVGNAQISTSVSKFGGGSMAFDGTDDRLIAPASPNLAFGTGDFTVEGWLYTSTPSTNMGIFQISGTAGGLQPSLNSLALYLDGPTFGAYYAATFKSGTTSVAANTWTHFALVRSSNVLRLYVNGVADSGFGSLTDNQNYTGQNICVGGYYSTAYLLNGYIDDLRITKYARYTANFTPPTAPFPLQ